MTYDQLIAALEAAEGPSREMDSRIQILLTDPSIMTDAGGYRGERPVVYTKASELVDGWRGDWRDFAMQINAPHYTASLDAALTLVPDEFYWSANRGFDDVGVPIGEERRYSACVAPHPFEIGGPYRWVWAATPALALCIAALRARKEQP